MCFLHVGECLCADVRRVDTRVHVHIIRHAGELRRPTNSARIAHLVLRNSSLADHGLRDVRYDPAPLRGDDVWLLFPQGRPEDGSDEVPPPPRRPDRPPRVLVVLDGNWPQARRMSKRLPIVPDLPRLAVPAPNPDTLRLRQPHAPWAMATIEAIARALDSLGEPDAATALDDAFGQFVIRTRRQRGEPPEGWPRGGVPG